MYVCIYVCKYACTMYVCMYVSMHVCMYVCMYVCKFVCMYACMYVCMYVCMYSSMYVCVYVCKCAPTTFFFSRRTLKQFLCARSRKNAQDENIITTVRVKPSERSARELCQSGLLWPISWFNIFYMKSEAIFIHFFFKNTPELYQSLAIESSSVRSFAVTLRCGIWLAWIRWVAARAPCCS